MGAVVLISLTPVSDILLRLSYRFRKPLADEKEMLHRIFASVCQAAKKDPGDYRVYVVDDPFPNGYALGSNNVAITRSILRDFPESELKGVLAHELGHLHYGDTIRKRVFVTVSIIGQAALTCYRLIGGIFNTLAVLPLPIINLMFWFIGIMFKLQVWIMELAMLSPLTIGAMFGSRLDEYRADRYAFEVGQGEGLISFLHRTMDTGNSSSGFLAILRRSHPASAERIRRIEQMKNKKGG